MILFTCCGKRPIASNFALTNRWRIYFQCLVGRFESITLFNYGYTYKRRLMSEKIKYFIMVFFSNSNAQAESNYVVYDR